MKRRVLLRAFEGVSHAKVGYSDVRRCRLHSDAKVFRLLPVQNVLPNKVRYWDVRRWSPHSHAKVLRLLPVENVLPNIIWKHYFCY